MGLNGIRGPFSVPLFVKTESDKRQSKERRKRIKECEQMISAESNMNSERDVKVCGKLGCNTSPPSRKCVSTHIR